MVFLNEQRQFFFSLCYHKHKLLHYVIYFLQRYCLALFKFVQQFWLNLKLYLYHHACFVVMWIKQLSVSKNELPIDFKTSVSSWCNWNIPSLTSPSLLLISLNISHIIGPDTVHFNNASLLSKNPMAPPFNGQFWSTYCLIYSNVREFYFFALFHCKIAFTKT